MKSLYLGISARWKSWFPLQIQALVALAKIPANPSVLAPKKSSLEGTNRTRARAGLAVSTESAELAPRLCLPLNPGLNPIFLEAWDFPEGSASFRAALGLPSDERLLHTHFCRNRSRWQEPTFLEEAHQDPFLGSVVHRPRRCREGEGSASCSPLSFGEGQLSPLPCNVKPDEKNPLASPLHAPWLWWCFLHRRQGISCKGWTRCRQPPGWAGALCEPGWWAARCSAPCKHQPGIRGGARALPSRPSSSLRQQPQRMCRGKVTGRPHGSAAGAGRASSTGAPSGTIRAGRPAASRAPAATVAKAFFPLFSYLFAQKGNFKGGVTKGESVESSFCAQDSEIWETPTHFRAGYHVGSGAASIPPSSDQIPPGTLQTQEDLVPLRWVR